MHYQKDLLTHSRKNKKPLPEIYQFRIWLKKISPSIWRRILIRDDSTVSDLHYTLQIAMGWTDTYLHEFKIHGKRYGITKEGGISFLDNPHKILLKDLRFRLKGKIAYLGENPHRIFSEYYFIFIYAHVKNSAFKAL